MTIITGDYNGSPVPISCTTEGKLETVTAIEGGTVSVNDIGRIGTVGQIAPETKRRGGKTMINTAGSPTQLLTTGVLTTSVLVKALHGNVGEVYVGGTNVGSATGYILQPDEFVSFPCDYAGSVYLDRDAGTQGVTWLYVGH